MKERNNREGRRMATQIAATPTLTGNDAKRLLNSLEKPTERSKKNGEKLLKFFERFEEKKD